MSPPGAGSEDKTTDKKQSAAIIEAFAALNPSDRELAEKQKICPVANSPLGSMGTPIKVDVDGQSVFICCEGCRDRLLDDPAKYLARLPKETIK